MAGSTGGVFSLCTNLCSICWCIQHFLKHPDSQHLSVLYLLSSMLRGLLVYGVLILVNLLPLAASSSLSSNNTKLCMLGLRVDLTRCPVQSQVLVEDSFPVYLVTLV